ncbi:threonine aldolase family protein [Solimicrobium silvestre]|uniref:Threonine aldolase n=1 Tax=Solimicrobium silvestre TaxID=2099400 RepID=A0A2S9H596_9BURK|nr:beta-eliminating lyase-related protein [Solimicrobium silvestre]PRC95111.1 Threonine aldolase [Solimicrobium silvestre]
MTEAELNQLRKQCHTLLGGHRQHDPAAEFAAMSAYCATHQIEHDTYGEGEFVQTFEQKIATLLGFEAGVFCITGTMTQTLALRLACAERGSSLVALHPTAHILKHENSNYQLLDHFKVQQCGDPYRTWNCADLQAVKDKIGCVLYELPMREIGGQLPSWDELDAIKNYCREQNIHLHMDGARLWEAQAGYGRPFTEITHGFDTIYVSFYKGIGGLGGAMLLGTKEFVAKAKVWMHRQGGSVFRRTPYVVAAAMQFEQRLADLPACFSRTRELVELIKNFPKLKINPATPQCNMFHLYLPVSRERAIEIRNQIAQQHGIWLFNRAATTALADQSYVEWTVGDQMLALTDTQVLAALTLLHAAF